MVVFTSTILHFKEGGELKGDNRGWMSRISARQAAPENRPALGTVHPCKALNRVQTMQLSMML